MDTKPYARNAARPSFSSCSFSGISSFCLNGFILDKVLRNLDSSGVGVGVGVGLGVISSSGVEGVEGVEKSFVEGFGCVAWVVGVNRRVTVGVRARAWGGRRREG